MPHIFLSKRFLDDAKIQSLPAGAKLLYLGLMLRRGEVDTTFFEASYEDLVRFSGGSGQAVQRLLALLESFQLVTYEKTPLNRIELNIKESNLIEKKGNEIKKPRPPKAAAPPGVQETIAHYCDEWKFRYGASAPIGGKISGQFRTLVKDHGAQRCKDFITAYFQMPDQWFVTKRHDVVTMISNLNAIAQFMETGRMFSKKEITQLDQNVATNNLIKSLREDGI